MPELGQTTDPKELIPGEPQAIANGVTALRTLGDRFATVGRDLGQIDVVSWTGEASNAFRDKLANEPPRWAKGNDALQGAAESLTGHSETLAWAQEQAARAIELWEQGEAATRQAMAEFNAATAAGAATTFVDPGEALRQQARDVLDRARQQLAQAGDLTAAELAKLTEPVASTDWRTRLPQVAEQTGAGQSTVGLGSREEWLRDSWTTGTMRDPKTTKPGEEWEIRLGETTLDPAETTTLAQGSASAAGFDLSGKVTRTDGPYETASAAVNQDGLKAGYSRGAGTTFTAEGEATNGAFSGKYKAEAGVGANVDANLTVGPTGVNAEASASAGARASAEGSVDYGIVGVDSKAEAFAGAEAGVDLGVGQDGVHAGVDAFAGARAGAELGADVGGLGAGVEAEAWAGAGFEAGLDVGMKDGKFVIEPELGAALGVGAKVAPTISVDPAKVIDTAAGAAGAVGDLVGDLNPFD